MLYLLGEYMYLYSMEKKIQGYSNYVFSDCGKVFSVKNGKRREIKGAYDKDGYLKITLVSDKKENKYFRKHRLIAWAFLGFSEKQVNHKDGVKDNNHLSNLEYVTQRENQCHRRLKKGYDIGVSWCKKSKKWRAYIQINKKWSHLGFFDNKQDAKQAYLNKLKECNIHNKYAF